MNVVSCVSEPVVTFSQQSGLWLDSLRTRKRKPVSPATLRVFRSYVRRLAPMIGEMKLADINNGTLKQLVQQLHAENLSPKTIAELLSVVKSVVASLVDPITGNRLFAVEWNSKFIDAPTIGAQHQPCATTKDVERCIRDAASDQERVLYCLLGGTGLRISECLAVRVDGTKLQTAWDRNALVIRVRATIFNGQELRRVKTPAAVREVDLDPRLNTFLDQFVAAQNIQPGEYLFQSRSGRAMHLKTARQRLAKHNISGFHCLRRHRITWLREQGVREEIIRYWAGHVGNEEEGFRQTITDRYSKLSENVELRRDWVLRAGLGFALPELGNGKPGHSAPQRTTKLAEPAKAKKPRRAAELGAMQATQIAEPAAPVSLTEAIIETYVGQDSDLPEIFFQVGVVS